MTNGDKVYIVTEGEYSDYHIIAVFATLEEAEKLVKFLNTDAEIEEYTLGVRFDLNTNKKGYRVRIHYHDGKPYIKFGSYIMINESIDDSDMLYILDDKDNKVIEDVYNVWDNGRPIIIHRYTVCVLAENEEKALKIASDAVAKYRAQEEGL